MSAETINLKKQESKITVSEILFGALLGITAISGIWLSTTILLHLLQKLY